MRDKQTKIATNKLIKQIIVVGDFNHEKMIKLQEERFDLSM